ncbi:MAG: CoA-binding protein [Cytophagales bacterium]|nr:MAG: CoA-binding protein [Cytophagales bacterium]
MQSKPITLILGATPNPERYAYQAALRLQKYQYPYVLVGIKKGEILAKNILNHKEIQPNIDTITLYIGAQNQPEWYDYILQTKPRRVIFNPGTENPELMEILAKNEIEVIPACTLVMLSTGQY